MSINDLNLANSSLEVKSSGNIDYFKDLELPEGKTIAELLEDHNNSSNLNTLSDNDSKKEE